MGVDILKRLVTFHQPIVVEDSRIEIASNSTPTMANVIVDLLSLNSQEVQEIDCIDAANTQGFRPRPVDIITSIIQAPGVENWDGFPRKPFLTALSIPFKKNGTGSCGLELPASFLENAVIDVAAGGKGKNKDPKWSSTLSPMGSLTHTHCDYHGAAQVMYHIVGEKLWLLWPPTTHNLEWWSMRKYAPAIENRTLEAIDGLEGLTIRWVTESTGFYLPPYGFHAVLTFTPSTHSGVRAWGYPWAKISFEGLERDIDWCARTLSLGLSIDRAKETLDEIDYELENWGRLVTVKKDDGVGAKFVGDKWVSMTNKIRTTKEILRRQTVRVPAI
jgi:hypothetical protein